VSETAEQIGRIADLFAAQERERTVFALNLKAEAEAMAARHKQERADLAAALGLKPAAVDQAAVAGTTGLQERRA
jgi:hypothetical protein